MANEQNLRPFASVSEAREMQKKSAKKRSDNIKEKKLIREIIEKRLKAHDLNEIVDNLIERAKTDSKDFEVLQAAMGQKPVDKLQMKTDVNIADSAERLSNIFEQIKEEK